MSGDGEEDGEGPTADLQPLGGMITEKEARFWRSQMESSLALWKEGAGYLALSEPDPAEREKIRGHLRAAIDTLDRVIGDHRPGRRRVSVRG